MKERIYPPLVLLLISAFLAPIAGGFVPTDSQMILPGQSALVLALKGDATVPLLAHALIALPMLVALVWVYLERRVLQVPNQKLLIPLVCLVGLTTVSIGFSQFPSAAVPAALEWLTYGGALVAGVAIVGRRSGALMVLSTVFVSCVVLALRGLVEYGSQPDKTWRIFGGWIGPNALAAMLLIGLFVGLGLVVSQNRMQSLLAGIGCVAIGFALALTQSKGAILALGVALPIFVFSLVVWARAGIGTSVARIVGVLVAVVALAGLLQVSQKNQAAQAGTPGASSALSRFANASQTQDQSVEFRRNLWKGTIQIAKEKPLGIGVGTYRYFSAKPGLTTQTQLAHQSYLQLLAEASFLAPIALIVLMLMWTSALWHGCKGMPKDRCAQRAGVFAAVVAIAAHSLVDSDFHYYGIGITLFLLMGTALMLCCDSVAPENTPKGIRGLLVSCVSIATLGLLYFGAGEVLRGEVRGQMASGDVSGAQAGVQSLTSMFPFDGESWFLASQFAKDPKERLGLLVNACRFAPSTKNYRALARTQIQAGDASAAILSYIKALSLDPNNLPALEQLLAVYASQGDTTSAASTATRLVAVEETPYFKVRSLPELVPLETAKARLYLAGQSTGKRKAELLSGALKLYRNYTSSTVPNIIEMGKLNPPMDYGGESVRSATESLTEAKGAAEQLAATQRELGDASAASEATKDAQGFEEALGKLAELDRK